MKPSVTPASLWRWAKEYSSDLLASVVIEDESNRRCPGLINRIVGDGIENLVADNISFTSFSGFAEGC
jgi:hypothetical protein